MAVAARSATRARTRGGVRQWLKRLHLWIGLGVGTVFALVGLSGSVLAFDTPLLLATYPRLAGHVLPDATQRAAVLDRIATQWPSQGLRAADLPTAKLPVWQLYFNDGTRRYLDPADGRLLLTRRSGSDGLLWLRSLHTDLLAGDTGGRVLGALGWVMLFLLLSGLVLWWPRRGRLRAQLRTYAQPSPRRWVSWHRSVGAIGLPLLLMVTLTGTLMIYNSGAARVLGVLFADPPVAAPPAPIPPRDVPIKWGAVLAAAQRALPGAALHRVSFAQGGDARINIRARAVGEWHPVGRSAVWLDPYRARVLAAHDVTRSGRGARVANTIYPIHAGDSGGMMWRILVALSGLLPAFFLATGFLFWRSRRKPRA